MSELPPIGLLLYLDAAARHRSFRGAAGELEVTPSAVSQRIAELERRVGLPLFRRTARSVALTEAGASYAAVAHEVATRHREGFEQLRRQYLDTSLRVSTTPVVAYEVLIPRIGAFHACHPDIDLRLETTTELVDLADDRVDAAIRFGAGEWEGTEAERLARGRVTVACSAELAEARSTWSLEEVLAGELISVDARGRDWSLLAHAAGVAPPGAERMRHCASHVEAALLAAQGLGFAVAILPVMAAWFRDGRLRNPIGHAWTTGYGYHGVWIARQRRDERVQRLFSWVRDAFAEMDPEGDQGDRGRTR